MFSDGCNAFPQPPLSSSRPAVTGYIVSYNSAGIINSSQTNESEFILDSVSVGVYSFTVQAINVVGVGSAGTVIANVTGRSKCYLIW